MRWGNVWVLPRNDRGEWELPGGRIDADDADHEDTLRRECREELGVDVEVGPHISSYTFEVVSGQHVDIICYSATAPADATFTVSEEHNAFGLFEIGELRDANVPSGYRKAIEKAAALGQA